MWGLVCGGTESDSQLPGRPALPSPDTHLDRSFRHQPETWRYDFWVTLLWSQDEPEEALHRGIDEDGGVFWGKEEHPAKSEGI